MKNILLIFSLIFFANYSFSQVQDSISGSYGSGTKTVKNYVKNSYCFANTKDITVSGGASISKTSTDPLEGNSSCTISASGSGGKVKFATRALDRIRKNGSCEISWAYEGDGTKWKVYVESNGVAISPEATNLISIGTDPQDDNFLIYSCGDLSYSSYVVFESIDVAPSMKVSSVGLSKTTKVLSGVTIGPRVKYNPTFTGFGTVATHDCYGQQVGTNEVIDCTFVAGTTTAVEARVSLRSGLTSVATLPALSIVGTMARDVVNSSHSYSALIEPGVNYVTFGAGEVSRSLLTKVTSSAVFSATNLLSFKAIIPVNEYSATTPFVTDRCKDRYACRVNLIFYYNGTTIVDNFGKSYPVSKSGTSSNIKTVDISSLALSEKMLCSTSPDSAGIVLANQNVSTSSNSAIVFQTYSSTISPTDNATILNCSKQGLDATKSEILNIVAQLKDYVKTPNTTSGKVGFCSAKISATGVISDPLGGCFASCTNATAPVCTFTTSYWKSGSVPNCGSQPLSGGFNGNAYILSNTQFSANILDSTGSGISGSREYFCYGEIQ